MARRSRTVGLNRLRRKLLVILPKELKDAVLAANEASGDEFMSEVRATLKRGDPRDGNLVDTLEMTYGTKRDETAVRVSIGGPEQPHPAHLEFGHRNVDGSHTPAHPFWFPARRKKARIRKTRMRNSVNAALKKLGYDA